LVCHAFAAIGSRDRPPRTVRAEKAWHPAASWVELPSSAEIEFADEPSDEREMDDAE
jgi:hypothetical protein